MKKFLTLVCSIFFMWSHRTLIGVLRIYLPKKVFLLLTKFYINLLCINLLCSLTKKPSLVANFLRRTMRMMTIMWNCLIRILIIYTTISMMRTRVHCYWSSVRQRLASMVSILCHNLASYAVSFVCFCTLCTSSLILCDCNFCWTF